MLCEDVREQPINAVERCTIHDDERCWREKRYNIRTTYQFFLAGKSSYLVQQRACWCLACISFVLHKPPYLNENPELMRNCQSLMSASNYFKLKLYVIFSYFFEVFDKILTLVLLWNRKIVPKPRVVNVLQRSIV